MIADVEKMIDGQVGRDNGHLPVFKVPISRLTVSDSPRSAGENAAHVQTLLESAGELPPIIVHRQTMNVIDGMHRLRAAVLRGDLEIEVRYFDGDERAAFLLAVKANVTHGLPLSLADRKAAAERILRGYPHLSDRMTAEIAGLSPKTVGVVRARLTEEIPQLTARIGKDGRARPLDRAQGRDVALGFLTEHPDASVHAVARAAGISRSTARAVREQWRNGGEEPPVGEPGPQERSDVVTSLSRPTAAIGNLKTLLRDPSLRHTNTGRMLLRLLDATVRGRGDWSRSADHLPLYCAPVVAEMARECAEAWREFAERLDRRDAGEAC